MEMKIWKDQSACSILLHRHFRPQTLRFLDRSLCSRRFQKHTRRERSREGAEGGAAHPSQLLPNFSCSPQACSLARPLFRSLAQSPPRKGKESAAKQATFTARCPSCAKEKSWGRECSNVSLLCCLEIWQSTVTCMTLHEKEQEINTKSLDLKPWSHGA